MIEKLEITRGAVDYLPDKWAFMYKINELIEAVNKLEKDTPGVGGVVGCDHSWYMVAIPVQECSKCHLRRFF